MSNQVLVTYATVTGSTADIAADIARTLEGHGLAAVAHPMREITDLSGYSAVVVGSAINSRAWLPEAMQFIQTHQDALRQRPVAAFLVCITLALKNKKWREQAHVEEWLAPVRAIVPTVSEGMFAGILDISKIPYRSARIGFRVSTWFGLLKQGDHRDWDAIRAWADGLPEKLVHATHEARGV